MKVMKKDLRIFSNTYFKSLLMVTALFAGTSFSQEVNAQDMDSRIGIKGGLNVSNLYIDEVDDQNARLGFHAGLFAKMPITTFFALQPELTYSTKGARADYDIVGVFEGENRFNLGYIDFPVLAVIDLGENFSIHAGPYVSYLLTSSVSSTGTFGSGVEELERDNFKSFDYGVAAGLGFVFGGAELGLRYSLGLNEIASDNAAEALLGDSKNSVAQLYIAFGL